MTKISKKYTLYYDIITLIICIGGMVLSRFVINVGLSLLIIRIIFISPWKEKLERIKENKYILLVFISFFFLNAISLLWTNNLNFGLNEIGRRVSLIIVPIALAIISPLSRKEMKILFISYISIIFLATLWGAMQLLLDPFADNRKLIASTSHIRFSLNLVFSILIILNLTFTYRKTIKKNYKILLYSIALWFLIYLFLTQAITGILILMFFGIIYIPYYLLKNKKTIKSLLILSIYVISLSLFILWIVKEKNNYFTPNEIYSQKIVEKTKYGGVYSNTNNPPLIENGNYINMYYCRDEVFLSWKERTNLSPYEYEGAIIRYLNSISPYKDKEHFDKLTDEDIKNIKNNIANKEYTRSFSLKPRLYQLFFQINSYQVEGKVKGFSELQRLELWINAEKLIEDNPLLGTGIGDFDSLFCNKLKERNSQLYGSMLKTHNQYLYIASTFGIFGLIFFIFWLLYPPIKKGVFFSFKYFAFFFISIASFLTEDTLLTLAGMMFYIFICSIFVFNKDALNINSPLFKK